MDGKSLDLKSEQLEKLKSLFPEIISEGKVDYEKLKLTLGEDVAITDERYVLNWAGKSDAFRAIQTPTMATLKPVPSDGLHLGGDVHLADNLFIEGENLEVLKVLQKSYYNKVKMIYIDPPYNTGNDNFIYPDKFSETKEEYLKRIGEMDEEGYLTKEGLFRKNSKESGRYHSNWLSMMYPRLFLARNLLRDDGVIFVSIDDNEVHNLRLMMNEIFGEENFVECFIWRSRLGKGSTAEQTATLHEYLLCFAKSISNLELLGDIRIRNKETKERIRQWGQGDRRIDRPTMFYPVESIEFGTVYPMKPDGTEGRWRISKEKFDELIYQGLVVFEKQEDGRIEAYRIYAEGTTTETAQDSILSPDIVKTTAHGSIEMAEFFGLKVFDYPKPSTLIRYLISFTVKEGIILDFFAGSGTTAQAVLQLNKEDGGNRKFILVQLPEKTDEASEAYKAGYKTIAEICKERIRRVIASVQNAKGKSKKEKDGHPERSEGSLFSSEGKDSSVVSSELPQNDSGEGLGFKVFRLEQSNFKIWRTDTIENEEDLKKQMEAFADPVKASSIEDNIACEILLKSGYELTTNVETLTLNGVTIYSAAEGEMMLALNSINEKVIEEIIKRKPKQFICLDKLFVRQTDGGQAGNDQLKTNTVLQMKDAGIGFEVI
jgi:DNA modification methylase